MEIRNIQIELPSRWRWMKLGNIVEEISTGFSSGKYNRENKGIPHIRPMNITSKGEMSFSEIKYVQTAECDHPLNGDILFNNTNSPELVGKSAILSQDTDWAYSNHITKIKVNNKIVYPKWIAYYLKYLYLNGYSCKIARITLIKPVFKQVSSRMS